jgi:undecaprenyl diphosphate synthase
MNPLKHVAIIMDGNGRWGLKNKNSRKEGHKQGLAVVEKIIDSAINKGIKYLTFFTFSTENWQRPKTEIRFLFKLLENFLLKKIDQLNDKEISLKVIGLKKFSKKLNNLLIRSEKITSKNKKIKIILALNYGSRSELVDTFKKLKKNKISFNEKNVSKNLYTKDIPDPDLLIRTGNTKRLSNFLLWQLSYTEIFFEKKLWPDFTKTDFNKIIKKYMKITRKYGQI